MPASNETVVAAIEAGGTKFRAATYSTSPGQSPALIDHVRIPTTTPDETMTEVAEFFAAARPVTAAGIASFGPLVVDSTSPGYGSIAATPKPGWSGFGLLATVRDALRVPTEIQTDVEAAAVAEQQLGAGVGTNPVAYVTVGTGIGIGVSIAGTPFRGRDHLELGHIPVTRGQGDDHPGVCPFHGDCLEGLCSGPAMLARAGVPAEELPEDHPLWDQVADELAQLVCVVTYGFSPDRIVFGGGVGSVTHLLPRIRVATARRLAGYSVSQSDNPDLIVATGLGNDAGLVGAALLAASMLES